MLSLTSRWLSLTLSRLQVPDLRFCASSFIHGFGVIANSPSCPTPLLRPATLLCLAPPSSYCRCGCCHISFGSEIQRILGTLLIEKETDFRSCSYWCFGMSFKIC